MSRNGPRLHVALGKLLLTFTFLFGCNSSTPRDPIACEPLTEPLPDILPDDPGRLRAEPEDDQAYLYQDDVLRTYELKLDEADLEKLDQDPVAEQYVPGTLQFEGKEYGPIGIRYIGSFGAWVGCTANSPPGGPPETWLNVGGRKVCPKLSLKISFNKYQKEGKFFGVKKLVFHAMNQDPSLMRERLGYQLFQEMGVPAPRTVHALVRINGEFAGVFLNVEHIDGRFTRSRFADGEGNLYKEIWPTASFNQTPPTETRFLGGLRTNRDENPSVEKILTFGEAAMHQVADIRTQAAADWLSINSTMSFIAVDRTIRADDGPFHFWCNGERCDNHNFFIYEEANADRLWLVPWDLDNAFVVNSKGTAADRFLTVIDEWDNPNARCGPRFGSLGWAEQMAPSCDPLLRTLGCNYHSQYEASVARLLEGPFSESSVEADLNRWAAQIEDAVVRANEQDAAQLSPDAWQASLVDFKERVRLLRARAAPVIQ